MLPSLNFNALEAFYFFWLERWLGYRLPEFYFTYLSELPELQHIWQTGMLEKEEFLQILTAVNTRDDKPIIHKAAYNFYQHNQKIINNLGYYFDLIFPLRKVKLSRFRDKDVQEIIFVPTIKQGSFKWDNNLYINFFSLHILPDGSIGLAGEKL